MRFGPFAGTGSVVCLMLKRRFRWAPSSVLVAVAEPLDAVAVLRLVCGEPSPTHPLVTWAPLNLDWGLASGEGL